MDVEIDQKPRFLGPQTQETDDSSMESDLALEPEGPSLGRARSSQRLRYEAEAGMIEKKIGDLELIRNQLGLSQRKICQLLLVDPSAWTRWTRAGEKAPPHIYRALQWYLLLQEKYPALDVNFWLSTVARTEDATLGFERDRKIAEFGEQLQNLGYQIAAVQKENAHSERRTAEAISGIHSYLQEMQSREKERFRWRMISFALMALMVIGLAFVAMT